MSERTTDEKRKALSDMYRAVAHMATAVAQVHSEKAMTFATGYGDDALVDLVGRWTAERMEILGDMLNGMDAVTGEDDWVAPIFAEANRLWPTTETTP